jgi:septal ring-binding cell division protein DamX
MDRAVAQGLVHVKDAPKGHWSLRLEIACQGETVRRVADLFPNEKPDLYLLPMAMRDGRGCYQVLYGDYPSKDAAEKAAKRLPPAFMADRNRPKSFQISEIPKEQ